MQPTSRTGLRLAFVTGLLLAFLSVGTPGVHGGTFPGVNGLLAFSSDRASAGSAEVYTMNADGTGVTQLTDAAGQSRYPSWSPDGTRIVFGSSRDGNWEIYVMNADGSGQTRLTFDAAEDASPSWSHDGTKIAFVSYRTTAGNPTGDSEIFVMNADGSGLTQLTDNLVADAGPSWSPNGNRIAFDRDAAGPSEIWVMKPDGSAQTQLTFNAGTQDVQASWSPDGGMIVWTRDFGGCSSADVQRMDADGTDQAPFICRGGHDSDGSYGPDGTRVAFVGFDGDHEVYIRDADGLSNETKLTDNSAFDGDVDWQPLSNYDFVGFFAPINGLPTLNRVKAGAAVPVKFSLNGDYGLDIFTAGYPKSLAIACDSGGSVDGIEDTVTAGSSGLSYDTASDTYTYVWKTSKGWKGTCRQLNVKLDDGTSYYANFMFT
ncbi:MAG TPA: PxKF domain-containing protein [Actinomycetota bacterium]